MIVFQTPRLAIRQYVPEEEGFVFDMHTREEVQRFLGAPLRTLEEARERIERWRAGYVTDRLQGAWAITLRGDGRIVGTVIFKRARHRSGVTRPTHEAGWRSYAPDDAQLCAIARGAGARSRAHPDVTRGDRRGDEQ